MRHKPSRLVRDTKNTVQFMGAKAFLATAQKTKSEKPFIERDFAVLKNRANRDSERLCALIALVDARAG